MSLFAPFRDPALARGQLDAIRRTVADYPGSMTLMEVCGTHTMAICQYGIRALLPPQIRLVSGPGCPDCVTPVDYVDRAVPLARRPHTLVATFGDMVRVPGSSSSLQREQAASGSVRVVYSPLDAVALAEKHPDQTVVFLGVGFETTAPTVAGAVVTAKRKGLANFFILCAHKTIPETMAVLAGDPGLQVNGYLCPPHVAAIIGADAFRPLAEGFRLPCVITGFEPLEVTLGGDRLAGSRLDLVLRPAGFGAQRRLDLGEPVGLAQAAAALLRAGRPRDALAFADASLAVAETPLAHKVAGEAHRQLGNRNRAVQHYSVYVTLAPDAPDRKQIEDAIAAVRGDVTVSPPR
jgi:hypothetical protein